MIRKFGRTARNAVLESVGRAASKYQERKPLPVDLLESDDDYLAVFDAPGVGPADVDVRFDRNTVRVRLERFRKHHEGFEVRAPGRATTLSGSVTLPDDATVDATAANAVLTETGTLEVRVPKHVDRRVERGTDEERAVDVGTGGEPPAGTDATAGDGAASDEEYDDVP